MNRRKLSSIVAIVLACAFAIEGVVGAGGMAFAVTGVVAGMSYALIGALYRDSALERR